MTDGDWWRETKPGRAKRGSRAALKRRSVNGSLSFEGEIMGAEWRTGFMGLGATPIKRRKARSDHSKPEERDCFRNYRGEMLEEREVEKLFFRTITILCEVGVQYLHFALFSLLFSII